MSSVFKSLHWRAGLVAAVACLVLYGCGGGGGGDTNVAQSVQILDSFGNVVVAGGADGVGPGDSGGDGTAGDGTAIVGGVVTVTDSNGKSVSATTDAQGYYRVKLTGFTPPFVVNVKRPDGVVRHSLSVKTPQVNGFINMNISGLTDKVASDVARAAGKGGAADLTPQIVAANAAVIGQSVSSLRSALSSVISASGIDPNSFDPLGTPFRPNSTGIDFVLDNTVVVVAADGSTQVTVSPNFTPPLTGNWQMSVSSSGQTINTGATFAGKDVPTVQTISSFGAAQFGSFLVPATVNGTGYTISVNGSTITTTGPNTNYTITINSVSTSNYQGCGACGVGSQVSFDMVVNATSSGLLDGFNEPTTTQSDSATITFQRIN